MITISLCMIVKNEEAVLDRCLRSICDAVDEIIIVDTGSTDATKEIARRYTDKIYDFPWIDDFSAARNESFSHARCEYQMWLDADDIVSKREKEKLMELKKELPPETDIVTMKYHTHQDANGNPTLTVRRERLLRCSKNYKWQDPVHECIPLAGRVYHSDIAIVHKKEQKPDAGPSFRNLHIYEKLAASGEPMTPRQLYYYARELKDHRFYDRAAGYFERFLNSGLGRNEDAIAACYNLAICYRRMKQNDKVLPALCRSFHYGTPRAEVLCEMAFHLRNINKPDQAAVWFELATQLEAPKTLGFFLCNYWGYFPHLHLGLYYYNKGEIEKAIYHNEQAGLAKPGDRFVKQNRKYYAEAKKKKDICKDKTGGG